MCNITELKPVVTVQDIINKFCWTIGMLPTSYKESLTYEEQLISIGNYLETTVIPALNNNAEAVSELQSLFIQLSNYVKNFFDNLNVQTEINNKLDEMLADGTLENILMNYTKLIKSFPTFQNAINDNSLILNQIIETHGFYTLNDQGASKYLITSTVTPLQLNNNLYALPISYPLNIMSLGAKNDASTDSYLIFDYAIKNFSTIFLPKGTYLISNTLEIPSNCHIYGEGPSLSILKANPIHSYNILSLVNTSYVMLNDFGIDGAIETGTTSTYSINGINLDYNISIDSFSILNNLQIFNCSNNGINILHQKETLFSNLILHNCGCGLYSKATDCRFENITSYWNGTNVINNITMPGYGFYIDQNSNSNKFVNCKAHSNHSHGFYFRGSWNNLTNIESQDNWQHGFYMYNCSNNNINSATFSTNSSSTLTENNTFNELCMQNVTNSYINCNVLSRNISWSSSYATTAINLLNNTFNNTLNCFYSPNENKPSQPINVVGVTNFNKITINNLKYYSDNLLDEFILASNFTPGLSNIFDNIISNDNDGSVQINKNLGTQQINYGPAQHTSPNGYYGVSKTLIENKSVTGNLIALAEYSMTNSENLVCVIQAQYYNNNNLLKQDRQFDSSGTIIFNKPIPDTTNKIILSFLVLSNKLNESGTINLSNIKASIM